jgi:hypothetical protein
VSADSESLVTPGEPCPGHFPACPHAEGFIACDACVDERAKTGAIFCADLDKCGGPGCMDHLPPANDRLATDGER